MEIAARYRSPEREFYREGFRDKDGLWTAYMTNVMVSAYNTRLVKKEEAPRTLEVLLKPRWKGTLTMDNRPMSGLEPSSNTSAKRRECVL